MSVRLLVRSSYQKMDAKRPPFVLSSFSRETKESASCCLACCSLGSNVHAQVIHTLQVPTALLGFSCYPCSRCGHPLTQTARQEKMQQLEAVYKIDVFWKVGIGIHLLKTNTFWLLTYTVISCLILRTVLQMGIFISTFST